jgi:hypothetical protein
MLLVLFQVVEMNGRMIREGICHLSRNKKRDQRLIAQVCTTECSRLTFHPIKAHECRSRLIKKDVEEQREGKRVLFDTVYKSLWPPRRHTGFSSALSEHSYRYRESELGSFTC